MVNSLSGAADHQSDCMGRYELWKYGLCTKEHLIANYHPLWVKRNEVNDIFRYLYRSKSTFEGMWCINDVLDEGGIFMGSVLPSDTPFGYCLSWNYWNDEVKDWNNDVTVSIFPILPLMEMSFNGQYSNQRDMSSEEVQGGFLFGGVCSSNLKYYTLLLKYLL